MKIDNSFSPFYDKKPNTTEKKYLKTLKFHHDTFVNFSKKIFLSNNTKSAIEVGSYLSNVAVRLKPFCDYFVATDVKTKGSRKNYKLWAKKNGLDIAFNHISKSGLKFEGLNKKKFDAILVSEVMEHLPYNPFDLVNSYKKYLNNNGLVIVSVPNRLSINKIIRFVTNKHPFLFFDDFLSDDLILRNYGHHWLEYNIKDLSYVFFKCGFKQKKLLKKNINYGNKINFYIKNIISIITFGLVFDQIYCEFKRNE